MYERITQSEKQIVFSNTQKGYIMVITKFFKIPETEYHLEVELRYELGGINYATYKEERRGIYLHLDTVERGSNFIRRTIFSDISGGDYKTGKILVKEMKRKSKKQMMDVFEAVDFEEIKDIWFSREYNELWDYLREKGLEV